MRFLIEADEHPAAWRLIDDDGHPVAWAGVPFPSRAGADQAAQEFCTEAESAVLEVDPVPELGWRWSAWLGADHRVAVSCGTFVEGGSRTGGAACPRDRGRATGP